MGGKSPRESKKRMYQNEKALNISAVAASRWLLSRLLLHQIGVRRVFMLLGLVLFDTQSLKAFEYEAGGLFEGEWHLYGGKIKKIEAVTFTVFVRDCRWMIRLRTKAMSPEGHEIVDSFDGTNHYRFAIYPEFMRENNVTWDGSVTTEEVPLSASVPNMSVIWMALADGCYFKNEKAMMPAPYSTYLPTPELSFKVRTRTDAVGLPERIVYLKTASDPVKGGPPNQRPGDVDWTNAIFAATGFRNIAGMEIPSEFSLSVYGKHPKSGVTNVFLEVEYRGYVTNLSPTCSLTEFIPQVPPGAFGRVTDFRFVHLDATYRQPFAYSTSNWLTSDEVKKLRGYAEYSVASRGVSGLNPAPLSAASTEVRTTAISIRRVIILLMVLGTLTLVFLLNKSLRRKAG